MEITTTQFFPSSIRFILNLSQKLRRIEFQNTFSSSLIINLLIRSIVYCIAMAS
jgi:hypothetical protein